MLGYTAVTRGASDPMPYMDGYPVILNSEGISSIFTPDESRPRMDLKWETEYYGTAEVVVCYPWYDDIETLPETVLFAMLRDAGSRTRNIGDEHREEILTYTWDAVELLMRINPRTGEITLPKDDAERRAWRAEADNMAAAVEKEKFTLKLEGEQTIGDVRFTLYDLISDPVSRTVRVETLIHGIYYPPELDSAKLQIYIDGVLANTIDDPYRNEPYVFSVENAEKYVERNGGWGTYNNCFGDAIIDMGARDNHLPDEFTLRVVWDVYDRNEDWERVFIGTFDVTTTVHKTDIAPWSRD